VSLSLLGRLGRRNGGRGLGRRKNDINFGPVAAIYTQAGLQEADMRYPIAIEPGTETTSFGVVVPDLPGCFSAGDTLDEAMEGAGEAVAAWIDAVLDAGTSIPPPSDMDAIARNPDYAGWTFGVITPGPAPLRVERDRVDSDK
jgi:predicted RNase H-like HicB family nuclease